MEEKMSIEERYQYLRRMKKRYLKANRKEPPVPSHSPPFHIHHIGATNFRNALFWNS